jgi:hypothetical protein
MIATSTHLQSKGESDMPDNKKSIMRIYDDGMAEVFKIVTSKKATPAQKKTAKQTAKDLTRMLVAHTLQTIEGRTALLSGLIVELNQVIDSVKTKSPYTGALTKMTGVLTKAETLFKEEKNKLI